jgi:deoxyribonuclease V
MYVKVPPHTWDVTPSMAIGVQKELKETVLGAMSPVPLENVRYIAGVDCSNTRFHPLITAGIIIWDRVDNLVIDSVYYQSNATFPYIPGLLSFREIPILLKAIEGLNREPDVWMVDGQGIAHPRRLGIAAHLGALIDRPTIGVAKSRLTGTFEEVGPVKGDQSPLMDKTDQIGVVYRSKPKSNPLFISPGYKMDISSSLAITEACMRGYRLPEPTRIAHVYVNEIRIAKTQPALL